MIPTTLDEAVDELLSHMDSLDRAEFLANQDFDYHFSGGMSLRNEWGLWGDSLLARWFKANEITHPDDMSATIYKALRCRLKREPFDITVEAAWYKQYWEESIKPQYANMILRRDKDGRLTYPWET